MNLIQCPLCKGAGRYGENGKNDCFACHGKGVMTEKEYESWIDDTGYGD